MFDLPEDTSNKKYINNEPEQVSVSREENTPVVTANSPIKKTESNIKKVKIPKKSLLTKENFTKLINYLKQKWIYFRTVQYPLIYSKIYDLYYFDLVPYKPIDIALKVLIMMTLLIVVLIIIMIFVELLRLVF